MVENLEILKDKKIAEFIDPENKFINKLIAKKNGSYNKDIIIKFGVDPTRPDIHLGHAVIFRFLRQMQDLGCKVVFLVGDFTANIGDPTGKSKVRPEIEQAEIESNMRTYLNQVGKILKTDKQSFSWIRNSDWFYAVSDMMPASSKIFLSVKKAGINFDAEISPSSFVGKSVLYSNTRMQLNNLGRSEIHSITLRGLLWTLRHITHQRLINRDMFQDRLKNGEELYMHEMLYPVLQGIDSFILSKIYNSCDLEIGGTDQTFNMLMGRDIMKINGVEEQAVLSCKILRGTDGKEKMSKSLDNFISIEESPSEIFGKVMSIPDSLIEEYFILCTDFSDDEIKESINKINSGHNPRDIKAQLAQEIVRIYHGKTASSSAISAFNNVFSKGEFPEDAKVIHGEPNEKLIDLLVNNKIVDSKSEFRRLIEAGAVSDFPNKKIVDPEESLNTKRKLRIGKKTFVIIELK